MKKGFTLIELLAVIVILAIIAVIAVPIVLNIIDETKDNASLQSADFYLDAVELSVAGATLKGQNIKDGTYNIMSDGNICLGTYNKTTTNETCVDTDSIDNNEILKVEVNGEVPKEGIITITNGNISDLSIVLNEKTIVKNSKGKLVFSNPVCTIERQTSGKYSVGDVVTCGTEQFYVIENEDEDTTPGIDMLSKFNLELTEKPKQDTSGATNSIVFSSNAYWTTYDGENGEFTDDFSEYRVGGTKYGQYPYIYDSLSNVYTYVELYRESLEKTEIKIIDAKLLSYEQAYNLGCTTQASGFISCDSMLSWITGNFWLGSGSEFGVWYLTDAEGQLILSYFPIFLSSANGVRPVITISKNNIK